MCLFNKHAGDGRQGLTEGEEFMESRTPWEASGIIADDTSEQPRQLALKAKREIFHRSETSLLFSHFAINRALTGIVT